MDEFVLDERLARDSLGIAELELSQLRLQNDARWPWLVLVPKRAGMSEVFDLSPPDRALLSAETMRVATALKALTFATKINIGALGNIVRQLHVHVIARIEGDAGWPGPVWGHGLPQPYETAARNEFVSRLSKALA